jgi:predicted nucleic acid-binding protein
MTVLIDTNVILDYVLPREPHADTARDCIERLLADKAKAWLTASTITDIYYVARRALRDADATKNVIAKLLGAFQIAGVDKGDCMSALALDMTDYEDALVAVCAKKIKADYVLTRNTKDFINSPVPAIKPIDFSDLYPRPPK